MSVQIVVSRRRFIVVRRISMPVCSEKGTSYCLVHKEESKKRDSDERNYFPRAKKSEREGAHETKGEEWRSRASTMKKRRRRTRRWRKTSDEWGGGYFCPRRRNHVAKWSAGYRVTERQELYCFAIARRVRRKGEGEGRTSAGNIRALISSRHKELSSTFCV